MADLPDLNQPRTPIMERLLAMVDKSGPIPEHRPDLGPCWVWTGYYHRYPNIGSENRVVRMLRAHRVAYERLVGPIPAGMVLDHLCCNTGCVNPAHLEPVTQRENVLRGRGPSALNARKTHCIRGHEFTPENTIVRPNGARFCRTCRVASSKRNTERRRARNEQRKKTLGLLEGS